MIHDEHIEAKEWGFSQFLRLWLVGYASYCRLWWYWLFSTRWQPLNTGSLIKKHSRTLSYICRKSGSAVRPQITRDRDVACQKSRSYHISFLYNRARDLSLDFKGWQLFALKTTGHVQLLCVFNKKMRNNYNEEFVERILIQWDVNVDVPYVWPC